MNKLVVTSLPRRVQFFVCLCFLVGALGTLTSGYTQKTTRPLTLQDAVEKENATTLRPKKGFKFEMSGKKIVAVEITFGALIRRHERGRSMPRASGNASVLLSSGRPPGGPW